MLATSFCLGLNAVAYGAASYSFEPVLSLTGDCSVSPRDEVPDPGVCPIPPGIPGVDHPSKAFTNPTVTTDLYGDIYVASVAEKASRIDIFGPDGSFLSEVEDKAGPQSIAVDSEGNLYVFERLAGGERQIRRFPPSIYKPLTGEIEYGATSEVIANLSTKLLISLGPETTLAINPADDFLFVDYGGGVAIFKSAKDGNELVTSEAIHVKRSGSIAIDSKHEKIYLSDKITGSSTVRVFELKAPFAELPEDEINGSATPQGEFLTGEGFLNLDVDEDTGHVFVGDLGVAKVVYEFEEDGTYLATIEHSFNATTNGEINIDDGPFSPNTGYLQVPSEPAGTGHVYAFEPKEECNPKVEAASVGEVTETDAILHATINPCGLETTYRLEYITRQQWEEEGKSFTNATIAGEGALPKGGEGVAVSAPALNLEPDTAYRFRAFAENSLSSASLERAFHTSATPPPPPDCPNDPLRSLFSAKLPDCRAYELVTPPDTNGHPPVGGFAGILLATPRTAPDGNLASFMVEGGLIPGQDGAGAFNGDPYLATRGGEGWSTSSAGPSGKEVVGPALRGGSPDQTYSFWEDIQGPVVYIRYPDGHSAVAGQGSLDSENVVTPELITENGSHIVFQTPVGGGAKQLEPNAPPAGTAAVYDRSAEGPTQVVSLLPGNETPKAGESATYLGASEEGEGIAFTINGSIYLRLHNAESFKVAGPGTKFAGVTKEGKRVFYTEGGNLFAFDTEKGKITFTSSTGNDVTPVNVAREGTRAYVVSPTVLTTEANPNGEEAKNGAENLYVSEEGSISFVGIVTKRDVNGEESLVGPIDGLGLWQESLSEAAPAVDPSRATPTGATLLFESRANLTGFESEGFAQIFRYDATESRLDCLSCGPTETPPTSDASLQSIQEEQFSPQPGGIHLQIPNQSPDGQRAFFQTTEPLVIGDTDGNLDVYEWEGEGTGSCENEGGCVYLISGGQSASPDYLFAVSRNGDDVFFRTADLLLPRDSESTLSIYDARVNGGFLEPSIGKPCEEGETCHPAPTPTPALPSFGSVPLPPEGEPGPRSCPKGKHKAKRNGKVVCVKKHRKHHHHRPAGANQKGGAK